MVYRHDYGASWALVIGINRYQRTSPLDFATNDARAVADVLEAKFGFERDNIRLLLDEQATRDNIRGAFLSFAKGDAVKPDDRLLVFFAGHGHTVRGKRGEVGLLVPVDGNPSDLETLIRWDELTRNADLITAKHVFFLMDACYGGLALVRGPSFGSMRFLGDMLQRYARQVLTAGKADETVSDGNGVRPGHSIFTAHLLDALDGKAATEDGIVTASGVMAYVYERVSRDQFSDQTPHYGFLDGDGDFVFDTSILKCAETGDRGPNGGLADRDVLVNTSPLIRDQFGQESSFVDRMKDLLAVPTNRIRLDDFVTVETKRFLADTDLRHFPTQEVAPAKESLERRLQLYEKNSTCLMQVAALLAKWADDDQLSVLRRIFVRLAEVDRGSAGYAAWVGLSWYPVSLIMYAAGISALANERYDALRTALMTPVRLAVNDERGDVAVVVPVMGRLSDTRDLFKLLPEHERNYVPRSEYLFKALQPGLEDLLFLGRSYEAMFDRFEVFVALVYSDQKPGGWGPPGRFAWKQSRGYGEPPLTALLKEAKAAGNDWAPLRAGLFGGSIERFQSVTENYLKLISQLGWF